MSRLARLHSSLLTAALALCACSPFETQPPAAADPLAASLPPATGDDFTRTLIVDVGGTPSGYVVEVLDVPQGLRDERPYPVGTWLVQDIDFTLVGFISPSGTAYVFGDDHRARPAGFGSRDMSVAAILKRQGHVTLRDA